LGAFVTGSPPRVCRSRRLSSRRRSPLGPPPLGQTGRSTAQARLLLADKRCSQVYRRSMRLSDDLEKKFQDQITLEFAASITYRQLAIEADEQDLPGIAAWLRHQADEELVHAAQFIQHVSDRGNHAATSAIPPPDVAPRLPARASVQAPLPAEA